MSTERKTPVTVGVSTRIVELVGREAKRRGISFADQARRVFDDWADGMEAKTTPKERILVMDRDTGVMRGAR